MEDPLYPSLNDDPSAYGRKGHTWHSDFVSYMVEIVTHPVYSEMPDAIKNDGKIQWEAPSNRSSGKYQNTHHRRRDWWRQKARDIGIDPESGEWISRTAKKIHPTGQKSCKRCGSIMRIAYAYPNAYLLKRLRAQFGVDFEVSVLESLPELVQRLSDSFGVDVLRKLPSILATKHLKPPKELGNSVDDWVTWIEDVYIPSEPSLLSPGAMSNAPDRLDGFHSFNRCCRNKADTGRHNINMRSYTTDRRVFEYWSEGDWIAADRLMGLIKAHYREHVSADGGDGPSTADHIGPLSLGFMHRPEFRLLSRSANSSKNNRMSLWDVTHLREAEASGTQVVSWYARYLWDLRKEDVIDDETALRLSKLMRDNQRLAMRLLHSIYESGFFGFLTHLLELKYASRNIEFIDLSIDSEGVTQFMRMNSLPRTTKYTQEQQARRLRIGFESLRAYGARQNRHLLEIGHNKVEEHITRACDYLSKAPQTVRAMDVELGTLFGASTPPSENSLRDVASRASCIEENGFVCAHRELKLAMEVIASIISDDWDSDRYVRAEFDLISD